MTTNNQFYPPTHVYEDRTTTWSCVGRDVSECMGYAEVLSASGLDYTSPFDPVARAVSLGERIVRCRDCKRFSLDNSDHDYRSGWWCHRWNTDMVKPDGFCAWGERKED